MNLKSNILKQLTLNPNGLTIRELTIKIFGNFGNKEEFNKDINKVRATINRDLIKPKIVIENVEKRNNSKVFSIKDGSEFTEIKLLKDLYDLMNNYMNFDKAPPSSVDELLKKIEEMLK